MRTIRTVAALLALSTLLSGCGAYENFRRTDFSKQDGNAISAAATSAMRDVSSMRLTGQVVLRGNQVLVDLSMNLEGRCTGTLRMGGSHLAVRRVGRRAWIKGDEGFYTSVSTMRVPAAALTRLSTSWIPADDTSILDLCDLAEFLKPFRVVDLVGEGRRGGGADAAADVLVAEEDTEDGRVVTLTADTGETAWVQSEAPHYVVRVESADLRDGGALTLSEFGRDVRVEVPRPKDVFRP